MSNSHHASIVLAAGKGTRMKSALPKVLHGIGGCSMLGHVIRAVRASGEGPCIVVIGQDMHDVREEALRFAPGADVVIQSRQLGTGDAVGCARGDLVGFDGQVIVLFGDTPLIRPETIARMVAAVRDQADVVVLGFRPVDATGYGRIVIDKTGAVTAIREETDATAAERAIDFCNSGVMAFRSPEMLFDLLGEVGTDNAKGEYYLTDVIAIAAARGHAIEARECPELEVLGINTRAHLARAEQALQERLRAHVMANGATLVDPASVFLSMDTVIGADVVIEPNVVFGQGVTVEDGVRIKGFCHFEGATIRSGATVGPFARLRPGADIGPDTKIGNFVEVKNAVIEQGAKVSHLSYVGDARVGADANIGGGTITCNYDGFNKLRTDIGTGAFIGANSALVAPVKIGDGAYVGSGSVVTKNVAPGALAVARGRQTDIPGWADRFRSMNKKKRKEA